MKDIEVASVGDKVSVKEYTGKTRGPFTVSAGCQGTRGVWMCATHKTTFANQFQKDVHIHAGVHKLAWVCPEHGPETP